MRNVFFTLFISLLLFISCDNQNIKETVYFETICKNLKNLKSNKNKNIKFFEH